MFYCTNRSVVKYLDGEREAKAIRCKRWSCDLCQPYRKKRLIAEAIRGHATTFLTITSRRSANGDPIKAAKDLVITWRRLRRVLVREHKIKSIPFLAVFEGTKTGWPHLHILLRGPFLPQARLSEFTNKQINSPVVWIERIRSDRKLASYISKYVGKKPFQFGTLKRYWQSRDYDIKTVRGGEPDKPPRSRGECHHHTLDYFHKVWTELGWPVQWVDRYTLRTVPQSFSGGP